MSVQLDKIRELCKERGISLWKLEQDLGFSNGSLAKSKNIRSDRLQMVAEYFQVPIDTFIESSSSKKKLVAVFKPAGQEQSHSEEKRPVVSGDLLFSKPKIDQEYLSGLVSDIVDKVIGDLSQESYYLDDQARELAQFMHDNPKYKVLFDASRKVKPEDIEKVKKMIDLFGDGTDDTGC